MRYVTRPLSNKTWLRPASRVPSRFSASWADTLALLQSEIGHLDGRNVVIEADVREGDIRVDGGIRANARAATPAVAVAFDSRRHGPLIYRCDRFAPDWQDNVRAIALTLQALRAVDRYGASSSGEQYTGYRQITAAPEAPTDRVAALRTIYSTAFPGAAYEPDAEPPMLDRAIQRARRLSHPDLNGGDHSAWEAVAAAVALLESGPTP